MAKSLTANVRPAILRHYYEAVFDGLATRFAGATFDEYYALFRLEYPTATKRSAVASATRNGRSDLAGQLVPDEPDGRLFAPTELDLVAEKYGLIRLNKRGPFDLGDHVKKTSKAIDCAGATLGNFAALTKATWVHVELRGCKAGDDAWPGDSSATIADALRIRWVDETTLAAATRVIRGRDVHVHHKNPVDLRLFASHDLERLSVSSPWTHGTLTQPKLRALRLVGESLSADVRALLSSCARSLEELSLSTLVPFAPEALPGAPHVRLLTVTAFPELREPWLDFAVRSNHIGFQFRRHYVPEKSYETVDTIGAADLARVVAGKKVHHELRLSSDPATVAQFRKSIASAKAGRPAAVGPTLVVTGDENDCRAAAAILEHGAPARPRAAAPTKRKAKKATSNEQEPMFADWEGSVAKPALAGARKTVADTQKALRAARADTRKQRAALRSYVKAFNALDARHKFIGTLEVEAIFDVFDGLAKSTKVADAADIIEELRDF